MLRLNAKLVEAIERQAELEDNLANALEELNAAKARINVLEAGQEAYKAELRRNMMLEITKADAESTKSKFAMSKEVEELTAKLFQEANEMVSEARQNAETEIGKAKQEAQSEQDKNHRLQAQLTDTETLLANHQAQLEELKGLMQGLSSASMNSRPTSPHPRNRRSRDSFPKIVTSLQNHGSESTPPTPSRLAQDPSVEDITTDASIAETTNEDDEEVEFVEAPETPAEETPAYRTDTTSYNDFLALLHVSLQNRSHQPALSRQASLSGINPQATTHGLKSPLTIQFLGASPASSTNSSPTFPSSLSGWTSASSDSKREVTLKETKFMKRTVVEDIEPTLRLDVAPELGYLSRRALREAVLDGNLVVEPLPAHLARFEPEKIPCSFCGDARYDGNHKRLYRCRADKADSQSHALCAWCLDRVRSVCNLVGFLKQVREGMWKADNEAAEMRAWQESIRLREACFWAKCGALNEQ